jgi:putative membrane protein
MSGLLKTGALAGVLALTWVGATMAVPDQDKPPATTPPSGTAAKPQDAKQHEASADSAFMREAAEGGMAEVELGRLANQNGESADVKQFGQRMVEDHGKANDELKSLAKQKNVDLPTQPNAKQKALHDKLSKMKGAQFDSAYMAAMVSDHQTDVAHFQRQAKSGKDPDVKAWAEKTLPTLQEHLKMAQEVRGKVGKTAATGKTGS